MNSPKTNHVTRSLLTIFLAAFVAATLQTSLHAQAADLDDDGVEDAVDNCPRIWNPDQANVFALDPAGDACDQATIFVTATRPANSGSMHMTYSGATVTLAAVARGGNQYMWDFGDGSPAMAWTAIANSYNLGVNHVYTGAIDQEFIATIHVRNSANPSVTWQTTFPIVIKQRTLDVETAMAIERGLWYLHTTMTRGTYAAGAPGHANPYGLWNEQLWFTIAGARAFAAQGHKLTGANRLTDPYSEDILRLTNYLMNAVTSGAISNQVHGAPDSNGNGYGLSVLGSGGSGGYYDGFMLDLLVHLGQPQWTADTGVATRVHGRTLKDISQDFIDWLAWGQADSGTYRGGWHYAANSNTADNSTTMYPITGLLAAKEMTPFALTIPAFVVNESMFWTNYSQNHTLNQPASGSFGYQGPNDCTAFGAGWYLCTVGTSSGILQLTLQGATSSHPNVQKALTYLGNNWGYVMSASAGATAGQSTYPMYAAMKALRHAEVTTLTRAGVPFDWYNSESTVSGGATYLGLRRRLVARQAANGSWSDTAGNAAFSGLMPTALSIVMLSPDDYIVSSTSTANDLSVTYNGSAHEGTGTCTHSAPGSAGPYQLNGTAIAGAPIDAGTYTFAWSCPGDSSHLPSSDTGTITIARAPTATSVVFDGGPYIYTGAPFTASATATGATLNEIEAVSYSGECTNVSPAGCTASAAFAGDENHLPSSGSMSIAILKAETTASIDCSIGAPFMYSGAAITPCVATASGAGTLSAVSSVTYSDNVNAGTATAIAVYPGDDNHNASPAATATFAIAKAAATVTAGSGTKLFGAADPVLTPSSSGFLPADGITVTQDARDAGEDVGSYATHASAGGPGISNYAVQSIDGSLEITRATAIVTAAGAAITYDGQAHAGTCTVAGVNGELLAGDASYTPGPGAPVSAGTYTLTCAFAGSGSYEPAAGTATITIDRADATVTAGSGTKLYGANDPVLTPGASGFLAGDAINVTQAARDAGENTGSYATHAAAAGAALGNYDVTFVDGSLTITSAPLTVRANDVTRTYGVANPSLTVTITGFVAGDTAAVLGGTLSVVTTATQLSPLGTYPIVPSGLTSSNYDIAFVNGTLTIDNTAPVCTAAAPSVSTIWEPNHQWIPITLTGVTDADGDTLAINVDRIFQDEPVDAAGSGNTATDGAGVGTSTAQVRAERGGPGNGRVYHITFTVTDTAGASCTATVKVSVPHSQSGAIAVDGGALFDSTIPVPKK